ncbi:hypothetical protein [Aureimonas pseudogalii]|uniref:Uncharacterized protein n=1 Tax=Aureimonas pseudogalii TaxID=1744844 RepID=A0A7W6H4E1_9HYPH|nr:hypothetical protein [Aureimonas pseudogalii]MBB3996904.1 hypothetical protein [Aureimonas pseudogalii]
MAFINAAPTKGRVTLTISERCPIEGRIEPRASIEMPIDAAELFIVELQLATGNARRQHRELTIARRVEVERELEAARLYVNQLETQLTDSAVSVEAPSHTTGRDATPSMAPPSPPANRNTTAKPSPPPFSRRF